jgi:hypothetical protein
VARGLFQRLAGTEAGRRVDWKHVKKITAAEIIVTDKGSRKVRKRRVKHSK